MVGARWLCHLLPPGATICHASFRSLFLFVPGPRLAPSPRPSPPRRGRGGTHRPTLGRRGAFPRPLRGGEGRGEGAPATVGGTDEMRPTCNCHALLACAG